MIEEVDVRVIDPRRGVFTTTTICPKDEELEYAEDLVHKLLDFMGAGPAYRTLFGLKVTNLSKWLESKKNRDCFLKKSNIRSDFTSFIINHSLKRFILKSPLWLAPNTKLRDLIENSETKLELELRLRFRPGSFLKLYRSDKGTFDLIFAQIRHDFLYKKFNEVDDDFVLIDGKVQGLVILDLVRYAIEKGIELERLLKEVNMKDFLPHKTSRLQQVILSVFTLPNIRNNLQVFHTHCEGSLETAKISFIDTFLNKVSTRDNGSETYYPALNLRKDDQGVPVEIRVRYSLKDSNCFIESRNIRLRDAMNQSPVRKLSKLEKLKWNTICDIYSIIHASLRGNNAILNHNYGSRAGTYTISFLSSWRAESFLSCIDGYYRLLKRCYFHLCRDITSPLLDRLRQIGSHGTTGWKYAESRLNHQRRVGTFLVRQCLITNNRFLIDVALESNIDATLEVDYNPKERTYRLIRYANSASLVMSASTFCETYGNLRALVLDVQIKINIGNNEVHQHLKYWLMPNEYDTCPIILLSLSLDKLFEITDEKASVYKDMLSQYPLHVPMGAITECEPITTSARNRFRVDKATFSGKKVVVKTLINNDAQRLAQDEYLVFHSCKKTHNDPQILNTFKPTQLRLVDWVFVNYRVFAATIGLYVIGSGLVQEFLPLGTLDRFLFVNSNVTNHSKSLISAQLADALLYLQEKQIIHGKLRCHNIFVSKARPIEIKVADPLGTYNIREDQAFIPPEVFGRSDKTCFSVYDSGIDVWAFGTTLWQVFSNGRRPAPGCFANKDLLRPKDCWRRMWDIIESCWVLDPGRRATPQTLYRDINEQCVWEQEFGDYCEIPEQASSEIGRASTSLCDQPSTSLTEPTSTTSRSDQPLTTQSVGTLSTMVVGHGGKMHDLLDAGITQRDAVIRSQWNARFFTDVKTHPYHRLSKFVSGYTLACPNTLALTNGESIPLSSLPEDIEGREWLVDSDRLQLGNLLGRGTSGCVRRGVLTHELEEKQVAVKCIEPGALNAEVGFEDLRREFSIMKDLDHENIVKIIGFVDDGDFMLVMEYMTCGSLQDYLKRPEITNYPLQKYALDIAKGMCYLESMKIVHRDLALRNILVANHNHVKICDFGLAQYLGQENHYQVKTQRPLPLKWYAPEVLATWKHTHKSDVWSYAVVLWEIYTGGSIPDYPTEIKDLYEILKNTRLSKPTACPDHIYDMMLKFCWAADPEDRPNFQQICDYLEQLQQPFIQFDNGRIFNTNYQQSSTF